MIFYYSKYKTISATLSYDATVIFSIRSLDDRRSNFRHIYFPTWAIFLFENSLENNEKVGLFKSNLTVTTRSSTLSQLVFHLFSWKHNLYARVYVCKFTTVSSVSSKYGMNYLLLISFEKSSFERVGKLALGSSVKLNWQVTEMVFSDMGILFSMQWEEFASRIWLKKL